MQTAPGCIDSGTDYFVTGAGQMDILSKLVGEYIEMHRETPDLLSRPKWVEAIRSGKEEVSAEGLASTFQLIQAHAFTEKQYRELDRKTRARLLTALRDLEGEQNSLQHRDMRPLSEELKGDWRLRAGDLRY